VNQWLVPLLLGLGLVACGGDASPAGPGETVSGDDTFFHNGNVSLHYALDLPPGRGPFPAVVVGHGAGRSTKDEARFMVPLWHEQGYAVLRYDRRGVGRSTGTYVPLGPQNSLSGVPELSSDMLAGVAFLRTRADIDHSRIGVTGVSQAGWIMVSAASQSSDVRFFVSIVGSAMPVATNTYYEGLRDLPIDVAYERLRAYAGPPGWDPLPALEETQAPGLWLFGDVDRLVPTRECLPRLASLGSGARNTTRVYSGFGHELSGSTVWWSDVASWLASLGLR
jgi:pimeloyl-ACP methyl ester carboxylesterase